MAGLLIEVQDYLTAEIQEPFAWGQNDCAMLADRWVQRVRGFSPLKKYGRQHTDRQSAMDWLTESGGGIINLAFRVCRASGLPRVRTPGPGDIAIFCTDDLVYMGICNGDYLVSRHERGWIMVNTKYASASWRVA